MGVDNVTVPAVSALSAIVGGCIGAGITAFVTLKVNKKSLYINSVTKERIQWLSIIRENFVDCKDKLQRILYLSKSLEVELFNFTGEQSDQDKLERKLRMELFEALHQYQKSVNMLILRLNWKDKIDYKVVKLFKDIYQILGNNITKSKNEQDWQKSVATKLAVIQEIIIEILKNEWEKVKDESEQGRLSDVRGWREKILCCVKWIIT